MQGLRTQSIFACHEYTCNTHCWLQSETLSLFWHSLAVVSHSGVSDGITNYMALPYPGRLAGIYSPSVLRVAPNSFGKYDQMV